MIAKRIRKSNILESNNTGDFVEGIGFLSLEQEVAKVQEGNTREDSNDRSEDYENDCFFAEF